MGEAHAQQDDTLLLFTIDQLGFAVPATQIESIVLPPEQLTHPPGSTPAHPGLFRHQGAVYTQVDMAAQLELEGTRPPGRLLLHRDGVRRYALHVDAVLGLVSPERGRWAALPPYLPRRTFPRGFLYQERIFLYSEPALLLRLEDHGTLRRHLQEIRAAHRDDKGETASAPSPEEQAASSLPPSAITPVSPGPVTSRVESASPAAERAQKVEPAQLRRPMTPAPRPEPEPKPAKSAAPISPAKKVRQPTPRPTATTQVEEPPRAIATTAPPAARTETRQPAAAPPIKRPAAPPSPPPSPVLPRESSESSPWPWLFGLALLLGAGALYWWQPWQATERPPRTNAYEPKPQPATPSPRTLPPPAPAVEAAPSPPSAVEKAEVAEPPAAGESVITETLESSRGLTLERHGDELRLIIDRSALPPAPAALSPTTTTAAETPIEEHAPEEGLAEAPEAPTTEEPTPPPAEPTPAVEEKAAAGASPADPALLAQWEFGETLPKLPPPEKTGNACFIHTVVHGDTLWAIAERYIGNPWHFRELASNSNIRNPDLIYPGDRIVILLR